MPDIDGQRSKVTADWRSDRAEMAQRLSDRQRKTKRILWCDGKRNKDLKRDTSTEEQNLVKEKWVRRKITCRNVAEVTWHLLDECMKNYMECIQDVPVTFCGTRLSWNLNLHSGPSVTRRSGDLSLVILRCVFWEAEGGSKCSTWGRRGWPWPLHY